MFLCVDVSGMLEIKAVSPGVVVIKGVEAGQYLSMGRDGRLIGSVRAIHHSLVLNVHIPTSD